MLLAGIDLAWHSNRNPSAIAVGQLDGNTLSVTEIEPAVYGTSSVFTALSAIEDLKGVAIDAPLIINNYAGQRLCENQVGKTYGSRGASCHTSNTKLYPDANSVQLSRKMEQLGFGHLDGDRWQIECYPHPAIIELFGLNQRLKYKKGRVGEKKAGQKILAKYLKQLDTSRVLNLKIPDEGNKFVDVDHIDSLSGQSLKTNEDALDALICLYIAALYAKNLCGQMFGDVDSGYIWIPQLLVLNQE